MIEQVGDVVVRHGVHRDQRQDQPGPVGLDHGFEVFQKPFVVPRQPIQIALGLQQIKPGDAHGKVEQGTESLSQISTKHNAHEKSR